LGGVQASWEADTLAVSCLNPQNYTPISNEICSQKRKSLGLPEFARNIPSGAGLMDCGV